MPKIVSPTNEKAKQEKLTAEEFFPQWREANFGNQTGPRIFLHDDEWLQFAEAYAQERVREFSIALNAKEVVIRRAAELLRPGYVTIEGDDWCEQRDQWLRDAGMEK